MKPFFERLEDYFTLPQPVAGESGHIEAHEHINTLVRYPVYLGTQHVCRKTGADEWFVETPEMPDEPGQTLPESTLYEVLFDAPNSDPNQIGIFVGAKYSTDFPIGTTITLYMFQSISSLGYRLKNITERLEALEGES